MATPPFDSCGFTLRIFHSWEWSRIDRELSGKIKKDINKKSVRWRFKMNPLKAHRMGLHPRLMTKHSPFRYIKPGPGFLDYLAWVCGLGIKSHALRFRLQCCMSSICAGRFCSVRGPWTKSRMPSKAI